MSLAKSGRSLESCLSFDTPLTPTHIAQTHVKGGFCDYAFFHSLRILDAMFELRLELPWHEENRITCVQGGRGEVSRGTTRGETRGGEMHLLIERATGKKRRRSDRCDVPAGVAIAI